MEVVILGGKMAAEIVSKRALGNPDKNLKYIMDQITDEVELQVSRYPPGIKGGGGVRDHNWRGGYSK